MKKIAVIIIAFLLLSGCATHKTNREISEAYGSQIQSWENVAVEREKTCQASIASCPRDEPYCQFAMATMCQMGGGTLASMPQMPGFVNPADEIRAYTGTISNLAGLGLSAWTINRTTKSNENIVEAGFNAVTGVTGTLAPSGPTTQINGDVIGGNQGDTTDVGGNQGDTSTVGRDSVGRDNSRGDTADNGSIINPGDFRDASPGPIEDSGNDNSDNSDNSDGG